MADNLKSSVKIPCHVNDKICY